MKESWLGSVARTAETVTSDTARQSIELRTLAELICPSRGVVDQGGGGVHKRTMSLALERQRSFRHGSPRMNVEVTDFQLLFDWLCKLAKQLLEKQGEFLPIGAIVTTEGKVGHVIANTKEEQPGAHKALELLEGGLRLMAAKGTCRAAGMAIDTRLKKAPRKEDVGKDAIWIILEEKRGASQGVFVPYARSLQGGFSYCSAFAQPEKARIFLTVN